MALNIPLSEADWQLTPEQVDYLHNRIITEMEPPQQ